uniref:Uncharacterized protein n=1 Tax=Onchocerca volvulus TaxID=6282 RepID=A0A8R1Y3T2_ONCVO
MSSIAIASSNIDIGLGAPYGLGQHKQPSSRMYLNFSTDYMQQSDMLIIFTHCYYLQMQKDMITKEIGRSVFSTVHGVRYIEWTLHVKKEQNQVVVELTRQTDTDIKGEFRVQFRAQSKKGKYRVEYVPHYTEKLMELYREEEFSPGQLNIEIRLAFASDDFNYIISKVDLNPLLKLEPESTTDKRLKAMLFVEENVALYVYLNFYFNNLYLKIYLKIQKLQLIY